MIVKKKKKDIQIHDKVEVTSVLEKMRFAFIMQKNDPNGVIK